jgi:hypothetical protein
MIPRIDKTLRRQVTADGKPFTVTLTPDGIKVVPKGKRNGIELTWTALVSGEAALAVALNASLAKLPAASPAAPAATTKRKAARARRR